MARFTRVRIHIYRLNLPNKQRVMQPSVGAFPRSRNTMALLPVGKTAVSQCLGDDDDDELMLNVLRCHLTY